MTEKGATPRDENTVTAKFGVLNTDLVQGTHLVPILINQSTNGIEIDTVSTISFTMQPVDPRDDNYAICWLFEGTDGLTYPAVATSMGRLLVST